MNKIRLAIMIIVGLLSIAAGAAKLMQMPQELNFLAALGFDNTMVMLLGGIQALGGLLLVTQKTRVVGGVLAAIGFAVSAFAIFLNGEIAFAAVSLLPVALAVSIIAGRPKPAPASDTL